MKLDIRVQHYVPFRLEQMTGDPFPVLAAGIEGLVRKKRHWWLSAGTLLGFVRDKAFIPTDTDIDVGMIGNYDRNAMPVDFELIRTVDNGNAQMQSAWRSKSTGIIFDILHYHYSDDLAQLYTARENNQIIYTPVRLVRPRGLLVHDGYPFPIPNKPDEYLQRWYGDWRTPNPSGKRQWDIYNG